MLSILFQVLIFLSYAVVALVLAKFLPAWTGVGSQIAQLLAFALMGLGVLLQVLLVGGGPQGARLGRLERATRALQKRTERLGSEIDGIRAEQEDAGERTERMIKELQVLQTLLKQVVERSGGGMARAAVRASSADADEEPGASEDARGREGDADGASARSEEGERVFSAEGVDQETLLKIVRGALTENRVDLYLQPIVALPSRRHVHYECFSRVRDEEQRVLYPQHFLPVAASTGLMGTVDNLLLFRLIQLVRKLGKRRAGVKFFCNIAEGSVEDEEFFPQFVDYMVANREFAQRMVFEFSQSYFLGLSGDTRRLLDMLGRAGYRFSIDRVENLSFTPEDLRALDVGYVKIPVSLLLAGDEGTARALRRRDILPIAEKVEAETEVVELLDRNVPLAQGFLFGEPRLARELSA